jgi:hypothetical protein
LSRHGQCGLLLDSSCRLWGSQKQDREDKQIENSTNFWLEWSTVKENKAGAWVAFDHERQALDWLLNAYYTSPYAPI